MSKWLICLTLAASLLTACNKSAPKSKAQDPVEQKLQELSGSGATNCGRVTAGSDVKNASACAMQASQGKRAFYVAYDLPGLTVAVAGAADGKLYSVQSQASQSEKDVTQTKPDATKATEVTSSPCPAELRVAQSGRVTCFPPGSFGMGSMGGSPHGGMTMPPPGTANPHGGMSMPPTGTPNPHGEKGAPVTEKTPLQRSLSN